MLNKFMKRGNQKGSKSDDVGFSPNPRGSGVVASSNVVVNHASRVGVPGSAGPNATPQGVGGGIIVATQPTGSVEALLLFKDVLVVERHNLFNFFISI
ncbi:unnamed protein product [Amaranthus hypochondriacus]